MELKALRTYLMEKAGTTEETPFGPEALVYKVVGKMFALVAWEDDPLSITLKCEPGQALLLRDVYPAVRPGYHMNKTHWNTIILCGTTHLPLIRHLLRRKTHAVSDANVFIVVEHGR